MITGCEESTVPTTLYTACEREPPPPYPAHKRSRAQLPAIPVSIQNHGRQAPAFDDITQTSSYIPPRNNYAQSAQSQQYQMQNDSYVMSSQTPAQNVTYQPNTSNYSAGIGVTSSHLMPATCCPSSSVSMNSNSLMSSVYGGTESDNLLNLLLAENSVSILETTTCTVPTSYQTSEFKVPQKSTNAQVIFGNCIFHFFAIVCKFFTFNSRSKRSQL